MTLKRTSLYQKHVDLKAKMAEFAGFEMPIQYTSVKEEALSVRNHSGVFDVGHMGEFFVTGPDAIPFVDSILTNDFAQVSMEKALYSPLCRENGTIVDDLIAYKLSEERVLICVNASNIEKDWKHISAQKGEFNIELVDRSQDYGLLALQGPETEKVLQKLELLPSEEFLYYSAKALSYSGEEIILARTGYTGEDGVEIFGPHQVIAEIWDCLIKEGVGPCGLASRDVLRLEVGYPLYGHELSDDWTPLDTGLKWTVRPEGRSFTGKDFLSSYTPKWRLIKLSLDKGIPRENYPIKNQEGLVIGKVTSGTMSVVLGKGICLGLVEKEKFPIDKKFLINIRNKDYEANYHTKPFIQGGHK